MRNKPTPLPDFVEEGWHMLECPQCGSEGNFFFNWGQPEPMPPFWPLCNNCIVGRIKALGVPELMMKPKADDS